MRPGEKLEAVKEEQLKVALERADDQGKISKKTSEFLHRWSLRGLVLLTLMSSGVKPVNPDGEYSEDEAIENVAENMRVELPEIVIYGHRDKKTDEIMNYLSSKEPLPEKIQKELEAKMFVHRVYSVCNAYENASQELKESQYSDYFREFVEYIKPKLDTMFDTEYAAYRDSDEFKKDFFEYKFATIPKYVFKFHPLKANDFQSKLEYFRIAFASCGPVGFDEMYPHSKDLSHEEIIERLSRDMPDLSNVTKANFSAKQYDAVWSMHQVHGNPKVKITEDFSPNKMEGTRAYYYGAYNEMYLGVGDSKTPLDLRDWIAELAHSEQYWVKYSKDEMDERNRQEDIFLDSISVIEGQQSEMNPNAFPVDWKVLKDKYMYDKEGTIEYEAHKIIEPQLRKELEERMKK